MAKAANLWTLYWLMDTHISGDTRELQSFTDANTSTFLQNGEFDIF